MQSISFIKQTVSEEKIFKDQEEAQSEKDSWTVY